MISNRLCGVLFVFLITFAVLIFSALERHVHDLKVVNGNIAATAFALVVWLIGFCCGTDGLHVSEQRYGKCSHRVSVIGNMIMGIGLVLLLSGAFCEKQCNDKMFALDVSGLVFLCSGAVAVTGAWVDVKFCRKNAHQRVSVLEE